MNQRRPGLIALTIAALCLFGTVKCQAFDLVPENWSNADTARQIAYTAIAVLDAGQTADIANHNDLEEVAPITRNVLGANPEAGEVAAYFTGAIIGNYAVSAMLKPKYRAVWQTLTLSVQSAVVGNNYRLGLTWGF